MVSISPQGYEQFDPEGQLTTGIKTTRASRPLALGTAQCHHLKGRGGIRAAVAKLRERVAAGVRYLCFMDDWAILCRTRWQMRRAIKRMHQVLASLGLQAHPQKTLIRKASRAFDFLGVEFCPPASGMHPPPHLRLSQASHARSRQRLHEKYQSCVRCYEQGVLRNLGGIKRPCRHHVQSPAPMLKSHLPDHRNFPLLDAPVG